MRLRHLSSCWQNHPLQVRDLGKGTFGVTKLMRSTPDGRAGGCQVPGAWPAGVLCCGQVMRCDDTIARP